MFSISKNNKFFFIKRCKRCKGKFFLTSFPEPFQISHIPCFPYYLAYLYMVRGITLKSILQNFTKRPGKPCMLSWPGTTSATNLSLNFYSLCIYSLQETNKLLSSNPQVTVTITSTFKSTSTSIK